MKHKNSGIYVLLSSKLLRALDISIICMQKCGIIYHIIYINDMFLEMRNYLNKNIPF